MIHCGATDLPDPAKLGNGAGRYDWESPRWLRDLRRDQPPQNLENKVSALEHWIGRFERTRAGSFTTFLTCGNGWPHREALGTQPSELGLALHERPWLRSSKGCVPPTTAFVDEPEIRGFLGESIAYTVSKLPRELLEKLGVRLRLTTANLIGELRRMRDSGPVDAELIVRIYRRLQTETVGSDAFRNERLIYLTEPTPRWCSVDETVWKDLGEPFDSYFGFVERTYAEEDLHRFFTQTLGASDEPSLRKLVEVWASMSSVIPDTAEFAEGRLREILRRCASELDELQAQSWWPEIRSRLVVWTTDRCFAQPERVYAPDDGFAEQVFAGKVAIGWVPTGQSTDRLGALHRSIGCLSLAGEIHGQVGSTGETALMETPEILTRASKELLFLWVCQTKGWEKRQPRLESLMRSAEALVESLSVEYSLHRPATSVCQNIAAFWSADEARLYFDLTSSAEARRSAAAKSIASGLGLATKDAEDTAYRLLMQSAAGVIALVAERKWLLSSEAQRWLEKLGIQRIVMTDTNDANASVSRTVRPRLTAQKEAVAVQPTSEKSSPTTVSAESTVQLDSQPDSKSGDIQRRKGGALSADVEPQTTNAEMSSHGPRAAATSAAQRIVSLNDSEREPRPLKSPDDEDAEVHVAAHTRLRSASRQRARAANSQASDNVEASNALASVSQHRKSEIEDMAVRHVLRQLQVRPEFRGFHAVDVRRSNHGYDLFVHGPARTGLRIEIKAHQSEATVVFITKGEWDESRRQAHYPWELWNVSNLASGDRVRIDRYLCVPDEAIIRESGYWVDLTKCGSQPVS